MPFYVVNGLRMHLNIRGKKAPPPCKAIVERRGIKCHCSGISSILCDWPVEAGTSDMPMSEEHAHEVGPDRHLCPIHAERQRA